MKSPLIVLMITLLAAGTARAQLLEQPASPVFGSSSTGMRSLPSASSVYAGSEGLPPADPKAPDLWRADPRLYAGIDLNPHLGIAAEFTNPDYRHGLHFRGHGPRLAKAVPLGEEGFNAELAARLTVPVDEQLSTFATLGMAAKVRKHDTGSTTVIGPAASVGATYKLNRKQSATAEIPLGDMARKAISGGAGGVGGRVKLGF